MESADTYCIPCNPTPPYGCDWPTNGTVLGEAELERYGLAATNMLLSIAEAQTKLLANLPFTCTVTQTVASATGTNVSRKVTFDIGFCGAGGGVKGAEHWNNPGHAPSYAPVSKCMGIGCGCQADPVWHVGAKHTLFHTRNLNHPDESVEDKKYQHCLGIVYSGKTTNLLDFIESFGVDLTDLVKWEINGKQQTKHELTIGDEPDDLDPKIFRIKLIEKASDTVWDRCILVVCSQETKSLYDAWVERWSQSANRTWLAELPAAYKTLGLNNSDPEPNVGSWYGNWLAPRSPPPKFYHHTAYWEMRSQKTANGHGNQACYTTNGVIISTGVCAGTADYSGPGWGKINVFHVRDDVNPFIRAIQLDGNPCKKAYGGTELSHALIFEGLNIGSYLHCRPPSVGILFPEPQ